MWPLRPRQTGCRTVTPTPRPWFRARDRTAVRTRSPPSRRAARPATSWSPGRDRRYGARGFSLSCDAVDDAVAALAVATRVQSQAAPPRATGHAGGETAIVSPPARLRRNRVRRRCFRSARGNVTRQFGVSFEVEPGQPPAEGARQAPVAVAEHVHDRGDEHGADDERVGDDGGGHAEPDHLDRAV